MDKNIETLSLLKMIGDAFRLKGDIEGFEIIPHGNINTTWRVYYKNPDKAYLFQKVNTYVFKDPRAVMKNIDLVTEHIRLKSEGKPALHYYHTASGDNFFIDANGGFWRICNYFDAVTFQTAPSAKTLEQTGKAFGEFQLKLADFDASLLHESIPDFHNTKKRLDRFFEHVALDEYGRVSEVRDEIEFIRAHREKGSVMTNLFESGTLPVRVTHNDTKINNILFSKDDLSPLVVIDLDTVMPGIVANDFGDAVRFAANKSPEDEAQTDKVSLDLELFESFTKGFLSSAAKTLSQPETDTLALGAFTITFELGVRFLDDYITGDKYFKVRRNKHNLDRTRCQLALAEDMEKKEKIMQNIVTTTAKKTN